MEAENEVFELCKQVYEATGWKQSPNISQLYEYWDDYDELCVISIEDADDALVPAYTSDYLLDKLPKFIDDRRLTLQPVIGNRWDASYDLINEADDSIYDSFAKTPLKALLKLSIELHEEKIL